MNKLGITKNTLQKHNERHCFTEKKTFLAVVVLEIRCFYVLAIVTSEIQRTQSRFQSLLRTCKVLPFSANIDFFQVSQTHQIYVLQLSGWKCH